ncbi:hypothetical protein OCU04_002697 [Sclerotinia nivalis]|uniref:Uncharacterized protein n=1 Tax=Sclerotinia nivalis TaxID=352851 RepID=A0A9X0AU64_9HELO|nr:hypothetical protein OCU04_002697 [Sclerotinia nivalis]
MPRQGQKKGDRDDAYKPGKDEEDIVDIDIDEVKPAKATIKPAKVTKPSQKGVPKQQSQKGTPKSTPKGTPKGTPRSTPKPPAAGAYKKPSPPPTAGAYIKPSPPPNTSTAAPSSTTIKTPSPSDPYFCCHQPLPLSSSFPPALENFYSFLVESLTTKFHPPPLESIPPSTTYYRFSHLSLTTCTEVHRYFLSLDPRNETEGVFVEGSEENVLGKAGALDEDGNVNRKQDVMILSRNARCEDHMKEGFWYVLMRVEQVVEVKKDVGIGLADVVVDGEELDHEIDLDLYT